MRPYDADAIASAVLAEFQKLPAKRKPCVRDNGIHEWVPLSGIVAKGPNFLRCLALATGMKCLPASKLPQARGMAVHDWHAEVLALRAFNRFVLQECRRLLAADDGEQPRPASDFLRRRADAELAAAAGGGPAGNARGHQQRQQQDEDGEEDQEERTWQRQPFAWRDDVSLHMYCSEAPCGDASMELVMAAQDDASPWALPGARAPLTATATTETAAKAPSPPLAAEPGQPRVAPGGELLGRGYFSELGVVRRKPARGDAPASVSKSCSDKLALKQCTSLLSAVASAVVSPRGVYLATLVLPASRFSAAACARCFSASSLSEWESSELLDCLPPGRMRALAGRRWGASGYAFAPVAVTTTQLEFEFSKTAVVGAGAGNEQETTTRRTGASNLAVVWTCDGLVEEGLIGGVLQGRKTFDEKGASAVSRRKMWELAVEVAGLLGNCHGHGHGDGDQSRAGDEDTGSGQTIASVLAAGTYDELKDGCPLLAARRRVKEEARAKALQGWLRNEGDGAFGLV
ncbi:adenosine deaminase/editase [Lasiosphaeria miniovina]|uniref:Adenosine deaminase/editase n=1 Tax=Lasiosphaeria miniovina TaxID=1954250 RepID=A0AA40AJV4_9PEZI|nr:adenosine deaminase/editase [Lasiosphaeria miniovina]KAK0717149.1 adenosine deaminase/editase [Lasiosphaeria miniovina]